MNDDIFADWKTSKFVVVSWLQDDLLNTKGPVIVLTDFSYWVKHIDELIVWCKTNGGKQQGMTIEFDNDENLTMFLLRWS